MKHKPTPFFYGTFNPLLGSASFLLQAILRATSAPVCDSQTKHPSEDFLFCFGSWLFNFFKRNQILVLAKHHAKYLHFPFLFQFFVGPQEPSIQSHKTPKKPKTYKIVFLTVFCLPSKIRQTKAKPRSTRYSRLCLMSLATICSGVCFLAQCLSMCSCAPFLLTYTPSHSKHLNFPFPSFISSTSFL